MTKDESTVLRTTTFQLPCSLHTQMRVMCVLTEKGMGEFIRIAITEKIAKLQEEQMGKR